MRTEISSSISTGASVLAVLWVIYEAQLAFRKPANSKSLKETEMSYAEEPLLDQTPPHVAVATADNTQEFYSALRQSHAEVTAIPNEKERFEKADHIAAEYARRFRVTDSDINQLVQSTKSHASIDLETRLLHVFSTDKYFYLYAVVQWDAMTLNLFRFKKALRRHTSAGGQLGEVTSRL
jgi:plasmid maintenance system antidote protein VapI